MWLTRRSDGEAASAVEVVGERFVVGRDEGCDLVLDDERVSRRHAYLRAHADGRAELHDLGSANGTFVNGHRLTGPVMLSGDERIQLGTTTLTTSLQRPTGDETRLDPVPVAAEAAAAGAAAERRGRLPRATWLALAAAAAAVVVASAAVALVATGALGGGNGDEAPAEATIPEIVEAVGPSTVVVNALVDGREAGSGSGWVLDAEEGLIVTNQHVTNPGNEFRVGVGDSQRPATLAAAAPCDDLALLRVEDTTGLVALPLGSQSELRPGQTVVALGFPGTASERDNLVPTAGVISVVETPFDQKAVDVPRYPNVIQTDAAINPGNSGGPLVDGHERLVGVNSAGITLLDGREVQGQGYAIGVDRAKEVLAALRAGRPAGWTGMGFAHVTAPTEVAAELRAAGLPAVPGLVVTHAVPGSPAAETGFGREPATITAVNGEPMDGSLQSYCAALGAGDADAASFTVVDRGPAPPRTVTVSFASGA